MSVSRNNGSVPGLLWLISPTLITLLHFFLPPLTLTRLNEQTSCLCFFFWFWNSNNLSNFQPLYQRIINSGRFKVIIWNVHNTATLECMISYFPHIYVLQERISTGKKVRLLWWDVVGRQPWIQLELELCYNLVNSELCNSWFFGVSGICKRIFTSFTEILQW